MTEPSEAAKQHLKRQAMDPRTAELLDWAKQAVSQMTPEEYLAMIEAQRQSFIRAMAPCEHGDPDWETCGQCRKEAGNGRGN